MDNQFCVWIADDDKSIRWVVEKALNKTGISTKTFSNASSILEALKHETPDTILSDIRMPGMDGFALLEQVQQSHPDLPIIIMTAHSDLDSAVSSFHGGAFDYLPKPFDINEMTALVERACLHRQQQNTKPQTNENQLSNTPEIIGEAPAMQEVFRIIGRLAKSNITVLINGQSGTGKELVAKALHQHSLRSQEAFIALNMAAIPKDLLESELFGHEKGAFTGAVSRRAGRFEQANNGTLFLDEIGDMPVELQTRLLRVLADHEFYPLGARSATKVNVRIIAATHQNLNELVKQGVFREDLFHRLNVIRIQIPSLNERSEDIPALLTHFLSVSAKELETETKAISTEAINYLRQLPWPGNIRQLENICRWLTVMTAGHEINLKDLPPELLDEEVSQQHTAMENSEWGSLLQEVVQNKLLNNDSQIAKDIIESAESILISTALKHTKGRRQEAAVLLGYGRNTLTRKIKELDIKDT
ncbi:MAG: nitrogen regulation protein NR(I) [Methyloprofundus sp.]|nr:nitrogen regulation protein NR(I) [Methyloprofundus sp.]